MNQAGIVFRYGTFANVVVFTTVCGGVGRFGPFDVDFVEFELEFQFGFMERVTDEEECCKE